MNRIPVCEVFDERPAVAVESDRTGVFRPLPGDECRITLTDVRPSSPSVDCAQSACLDDGAAGGAYERRLVIGEAECTVDRGVEAVLRGMRTGEVREFCVGDGRGGRVEGRVALTGLRKDERKAGWRCGDDRLRLADAARHKAAGNRLYMGGRYADAFHRFSAAARLVLFVRDVNAACDDTTRDKLYASVCNNMAACQLRMANYEHVVQLCSKVLAVEPDNAKAMVRRCRASVELRSYDSAAEDARHVLQYEPRNVEAKRCLQAAVLGIRAQDDNYRHMVKRMFA